MNRSRYSNGTSTRSSFFQKPGLMLRALTVLLLQRLAPFPVRLAGGHLERPVIHHITRLGFGDPAAVQVLVTAAAVYVALLSGHILRLQVSGCLVGQLDQKPGPGELLWGLLGSHAASS